VTYPASSALEVRELEHALADEAIEALTPFGPRARPAELATALLNRNK
jgi:hypothetical protein